MSRIVIDTQLMQTIALFERETGAQVKDCVSGDNQLVFIVNEGEMAKAIGKGGKNVRDMEYMLKKRVKIVEYSAELIQFIKNVVSPLELRETRAEEGKIFLDAKDLKTRGLLIGRSASNLRFFESIVKRYFPIQELRVV